MVTLLASEETVMPLPPLSAITLPWLASVPPITIPLPAEPVAIGATWEETHTISVELKDKLKKGIGVRRQFTLKSVTDDVAVIGVEFQALTPIIDPAIEAQLIQHFTVGDIQFNLAEGRIDSQQIALDKRVLGFAGPASSLHYQMQLTETLATETPQVATRPN